MPKTELEISETGLAIAFAAFDNRALFLKPGDKLEISATLDGKAYVVALNNSLLVRSGGDLLLKIESNRRRATAKTILRSKRARIGRKGKATTISGMFE